MTTLQFPSGLNAQPLSPSDFNFQGELGSEGATISELTVNHFRIDLGHAPGHADWSNKLQFTIEQHAQGNAPQIDVYFIGGRTYPFNEYYYSWSYDKINWNPVYWQGNTLIFPSFTQDRVYVGHQTPMSYNDVTILMQQWSNHPHATLITLGQSIEGRNIYQLEITDPQSPYPENIRWCHYIINQHPGEHNSQWRMAGMVDWLLSEAGSDCRRRSITYFTLMMSPDSPSHGWYRVNAQGVDMNRSYYVSGCDPQNQAHEAYICQQNLETVMASQTPVTDIWNMHTWPGITETLLLTGPEMGNRIGQWTELRDIIESNDPNNLHKPLYLSDRTDPSAWNVGPNVQFGITNFLCEGGGNIYTKAENMQAGEIIMKSLDQYYHGTAADPDLPNPPTNPAADASTPGQVELNWQDNAGDEHGYTVQRKPWLGTPNWQIIADLPPDSTMYTDTTLIHGQVNYTYRVGAYKE